LGLELHKSNGTSSTNGGITGTTAMIFSSSTIGAVYLNKHHFFVAGIINYMVYFNVTVFIFIYTNINLMGKVS